MPIRESAAGVKLSETWYESASVTRGNVAGSHTPGNITPETRLPGWGTWIRTKIDGVRVRCSTVELSPTRSPQKSLEKKDFEMPKRAASYRSQIKSSRESAGGRDRVLSNLRAEVGEMTLQHIRSRRHVLGRRAVPLDDRRNDAGR